MTKQMLLDLVKQIKKRNKVLIIAVAVLVALFVGMTIFAFSSFEIGYEETTKIEIDNDDNQKVEIDGSGGNNITQSVVNDNSMKEQTENDNVYLICGTVIVCMGLIIVGVYIYGKSKRKHTHAYKDEDNKDKKIDD